MAQDYIPPHLLKESPISNPLSLLYHNISLFTGTFLLVYTYVITLYTLKTNFVGSISLLCY